MLRVDGSDRFSRASKDRILDMSRWRYFTYLVCVVLLPVANAGATEPMLGDSWWHGQPAMGGGYAPASDPYAHAAGPAQQSFAYEDYASCGPTMQEQLPINCGYFFQYDYLLWSVNAPRHHHWRRRLRTHGQRRWR